MDATHKMVVAMRGVLNQHVNDMGEYMEDKKRHAASPLAPDAQVSRALKDQRIRQRIRQGQRIC